MGPVSGHTPVTVRREAWENRGVMEAAYEAGLALEALGADELMMMREEAAQVAAEREGMRRKCECVMAVLQAVTAGVAGVGEIRDRVAVLAQEVDAGLLEGLPRVKGRALRQAWSVTSAGVLGVSWEPAAGLVLLQFILQNGWSEREVGKRVLCLLYSFQSNKHQRPGLAQSFETIGVAIGLKAKNKRSAISAAMKVIAGDLLSALARRDRSHVHVKPWYAKREECRRKLSVSMMGQRNRAKKE